MDDDVHHRASDAAIDIQVTNFEFFFHTSDIRRTARENPASQCILSAIRDLQSLILSF